MGKTIKMPGVFVGSYDPLQFLTLVREELAERRPLVSTIVIALDSAGHLTIHTSSPERERNLGLLGLAQRHTLNEFGEAIAEGYSLAFDPEDPTAA